MTLTDLRAEFEPQLISPNGAHLSLPLCAESWDEEFGLEDKHGDQGYQLMLDRCAEWLAGVNKTKRVTYYATSYGYKHEVEKFFHLKHGEWADTYVTNGAFIMAAVRAGFQYLPQSGRYCHTRGYIWDCYNVLLNIGRQRLPFPKVPIRPMFLPEGVK